MRAPDQIVRHIIRCDWRCKHCSTIIGSERIAHYGADLPNVVRPTWFFASMTLLDHLRDCQSHDYSPELKSEFGPDFLNHLQICNWYNLHALIERHFLGEEELE